MRDNTVSELSDRNKSIVERFFTEVFNQGNMSVVDETLAPNYHYNGVASDAAGTKAWAEGLRKQFPDLHFTIEDSLAEDEKVALRWRMDVTGPGGKKGYVQGTNIIVMRDDQAVTNDQGGGKDFVWAD